MAAGFAMLTVVLAAGSATAQSADGGESPEAVPSEEATADSLAKRLVERAGDPTSVDRLAFSFVVEVAGQEMVRRRHVWRPKKGRLTVTSGEQEIRLKGLHDHDLTALAEKPDEHAETWKEIAPKSEPAKAAEAWGWFINDSYWLLAPSKVLDPGVNRKLDEEGRLVLTFGKVGLTPGDRYRLTVDRDRGVVTRWQFTLQGGREGAFRWKNYETFGPLHLSTRRVAEGEGPRTVIWFDKVEVEE